MEREATYIGNEEIMGLRKTGFLASGKIETRAVLRAYDWATEMRDRGECVISGFSSKIERDVLHFLLKGRQPIIVVLARAMYREVPEELREAVEEGRLLIVSTTKAVRQSKATAAARNRYVCEKAERIVFVGVHEGSSLKELREEYRAKEEEM